MDAFFTICAWFFFSYRFVRWWLVVVCNVFEFVPVVAVVFVKI